MSHSYSIKAQYKDHVNNQYNVQKHHMMRSEKSALCMNLYSKWVDHQFHQLSCDQNINCHVINNHLTNYGRCSFVMSINSSLLTLDTNDWLSKEHPTLPFRYL